MGNHKASQNAAFVATHNLEVPGSSPGWSTTKNHKENEKDFYIFDSCSNVLHKCLGTRKAIQQC